jgi:ureidoglycolate lyase
VSPAARNPGAAARPVAAQLLTPHAFASFGEVIARDGAFPRAQDFAVAPTSTRPAARLNVSLRSVLPWPSPPIVDLLEIHPHSHQLFVPMDGCRYLVAVCPAGADGGPDTARLAAFIVAGHQAVNYRAGIWHAPMATLGAPGSLVMLRWDCGDDRDTRLCPLEDPITVTGV